MSNVKCQISIYRLLMNHQPNIHTHFTKSMPTQSSVTFVNDNHKFVASHSPVVRSVTRKIRVVMTVLTCTNERITARHDLTSHPPHNRSQPFTQRFTPYILIVPYRTPPSSFLVSKSLLTKMYNFPNRPKNERIYMNI
jgi:hypothetical protein